MSDAVVSFFLAYLIHVMVQQPLKNLLQISFLWRRIFPVTPINSFTLKSSSPANTDTFLERTKTGAHSSASVNDNLPGYPLSQEPVEHLQLHRNSVMLDLSEKVRDNNNNKL